VQQAQEAATKSKTQGLRRFWFELQGSIIQLQAIKRLPEIRIIFRIGGKQSCKHPGLHGLETGQRLCCTILGQRYRFTHGGAVYLFDARHQETNLSG